MNANLAALPSSPTAAQASRDGIDLLAATVRLAVAHADLAFCRHSTLKWLRAACTSAARILTAGRTTACTVRRWRLTRMARQLLLHHQVGCHAQPHLTQALLLQLPASPTAQLPRQQVLPQPQHMLGMHAAHRSSMALANQLQRHFVPEQEPAQLRRLSRGLQRGQHWAPRSHCYRGSQRASPVAWASRR